MEGKRCRCCEEDVEVAEVEDDNDPTSELLYETVYHTLVAIAGLLEDVPNRLVPIGDLEINVEAVGIRASRSGTGCRQSRSYATLMSKRPG